MKKLTFFSIAVLIAFLSVYSIKTGKDLNDLFVLKRELRKLTLGEIFFLEQRLESLQEKLSGNVFIWSVSARYYFKYQYPINDDPEVKKEYLDKAKYAAKMGLKANPTNLVLRELEADLKKEVLID